MSTQMNPTEFHDRLDAVLREAGEPATGVAIDADIVLGRRLLRRRRGVVAVGAASLVAVAAVVGGVAWSAADRPAQGPGVSAAPSSAADLLDACRKGNQSARATQLMFGAGDPRIKVETQTPVQTVLALEAADGRHWAWCWIGPRSAEFPSGMEVYDATGTTRNSMYSSAPACAGSTDDCRAFSLVVVDRRPEEVAAVEFWTADGERTTVESVDGYIVLNYVGTVPEGTAMTPEGVPVDFAPMKRITFLDHSGAPIAAEAQDGSGEGPDGEWIPGLPSIREFPALRGGQSVY
jgi:hypothetical protein